MSEIESESTVAVDTKHCSKCNRERPRSCFNKRSGASDGLQAYCRECQSGHYKANADRHKANVARRGKMIYTQSRLRIIEHLNANPCVDCGEQDLRVLEFDHVRGQKRANVAALVGNGYSWAVVLEEIEKCDVRCANCHRRRTADQLGYYAYVQAPTTLARMRDGEA